VIARSPTPLAAGPLRAVLRSAAFLVAASVVTLGAATAGAYANAADCAPHHIHRWAPSPDATHRIHNRADARRAGKGNAPRHAAAAHQLNVRSHRWKAASRAGRQVERHGFISLPVPTGTARPALAVRDALAQLGKPYAFGKTGPWAFDCSGLTQHAWRAAGMHIPRTSEEQADFGRAIDIRRIQPGDLVVYYPHRSHVAIYVGGGRVVYAPHTGAFVRLGGLYSMPINVVRRP